MFTGSTVDGHEDGKRETVEEVVKLLEYVRVCTHACVCAMCCQYAI